MSSSLSIKTIGKYLDQPALIKKMNKLVPIALSGIGAGYIAAKTFEARKENKKKVFIQTASTMAFTIGSAIIAAKGLKINGKRIFNGLAEHCHHHHHEIEHIKNKSLDIRTVELIDEVLGGKILGLKKIKQLTSNLKKEFGDEKLINEIIPNAHSHKPFQELADLSWLGLVPVLGGIAGGMIGDILTKDKWKEKFPNKAKEGLYQYLNNIFLCNVGAGIAMITMNKLNVQNKAIRVVGMLTGVIGVGLLAGSAIANFISKNLLNPIFDKTNKRPDNFKEMTKNLNSERHPEALDLSLHIDDIASVGFLSGFKWIGPILPALYSVSGFRAGMGYRNGHEHHHSKN